MRLGNINNVITICVTAFTLTLSVSVANADPLKIAPIKIDPAFNLSKAGKANPLMIAPIKMDPAFDLTKTKNATPLSTVCVDEKLVSKITAKELDEAWVDVASEQVDLASERISLRPAWVDVDPAWVDVNPASSISEDTSPFNSAWLDEGSDSITSATEVTGPSETACVDVKHSVASGVPESDILESLEYMDLDAAVESILKADGNQQSTLIAALITDPEYEFIPLDPTAGFEPTAAGGPKPSGGRGEGVSP